MKAFIKQIFSENDGKASSKRLISILSFFVFVGMIIYSFSSGKTIDSSYIYGILSLIGGTSLMSVVEKFKN